MIKKLTDKQIGALSFYREKWLRIGLNTEQVTFADALKVRDCVERLLDKKYPVTILLDSPLSAWIAVCLFSNKENEAQVGAQVREQVWAQVYKCGYGQHDSEWLAFYDAFRAVVGVKGL